MDPSYNNSFGSQGPAQGVIASGNGTPGAGAPGVTMSGNGTPGAGVPAQPAMPIASGTGAGDIVLAPEKKSKKGLVIGLVLGVVAVVVAVVVGVAVIGNNGKTAENIQGAFAELFSYVEDLKTKSEEQDFDIELDETYDELDKKYQSFNGLFEKSDLKKQLDGDSEKLKKYIYVTEIVMRPDLVLDEMEKQYDDDKEAVVNEILEMETLVEESDKIYVATVLAFKYYEAAMGLYATYYEIGCLQGGEMGFDCAAEKYGEKFSLNVRESEVQEAKFKLQDKAIIKIIINSLYSLLSDINNEIGSKNA